MGAALAGRRGLEGSQAVAQCPSELSQANGASEPPGVETPV
jgi:hypothetical protein